MSFLVSFPGGTGFQPVLLDNETFAPVENRCHPGRVETAVLLALCNTKHHMRNFKVRLHGGELGERRDVSPPVLLKSLACAAG